MKEQNEGIVVATRGRLFEVRAEDGSLIKCEVRGKVKAEVEAVTPVAVGDRVIYTVSHKKAGAIEKVLERKTSFHRPGVMIGSQKQVIAANIDRLAIVVSTKSPKLKTGLIDRFLIAAYKGELEPFIILNKIDLEKAENFAEIISAYRSVDVPVFPVSAVTKEGLDDLESNLKGHISLFVGHSGVGKTSILNNLIPGLNLKTRRISSYSNRGKHATSNIELFEIPAGGFIVDSPGLKVMGLWDASPDELVLYYPEFEPYIGQCRFSTCSHTHEPDCAVKQAVAEGAFPAFRYDNYQALYRDLSE